MLQRLSRHSPRRRGFTMIEIIIVILVLVALTAIAMPRMKGSLIRARLQGGARDVVALLRFARDAAVLREKPVQIVFTPDEDTYELQLLEADLSVEETRRSVSRRRRNEVLLSLGDDAAGERTLPQGVHFAVIFSAAPLAGRNDLPRVIYYPDGSATPATLALQTDTGQALNVEIYRTTGMAKVGPGLPKQTPRNQKLYYGPELD